MSQQILLGTGMYSFPRASQLTGLSTQNLRRWALGRPSPIGSTSHEPIVHLDLPDVDDERALSFLNLIELKLIGEFRRLGLPLQYIRQVVDVLRDSYDFAHPLACKRLLTDGKSIFADIDDMGEFACIEIAGKRPNHLVIDEVVRPFFMDIEFYEETSLARRWFPEGPGAGIVIDPSVSFGEPVLVGSGLQTALLASLSLAGDSAKSIADWYEVTPQEVERAVMFEHRLVRRAAA